MLAHNTNYNPFHPVLCILCFEYNSFEAINWLHSFLENYVSTKVLRTCTSNWFPPCDLMYYVATYPSTLFWSQNNQISQWSGSLTLFLAAFSGIDQNWHQWIRLEFYSKIMKVNMFSNNYGYHVTCWTSAIVLSAFHNKLRWA